MYIIPEASDRIQQVGLRGFAQSPAQSEYQKSLDAILGVLRLNPVGGYLKGSSARKRLEEAFQSVSPTSARELFNQLKEGESPLGRLFRYRLDRVTKAVMLEILRRKILSNAEDELSQAQKAMQERLENARKEMIEEQCTRLKEAKKRAEEVCRSQGEDSDVCQKIRFTLLEHQMAVNKAIRLTGVRCP